MVLFSSAACLFLDLLAIDQMDGKMLSFEDHVYQCFIHRDTNMQQMIIAGQKNLKS